MLEFETVDQLPGRATQLSTEIDAIVLHLEREYSAGGEDFVRIRGLSSNDPTKYVAPLKKRGMKAHTRTVDDVVDLYARVSNE